MFSVSPDERWLVYARSVADSLGRRDPEIRVRDLNARRDSAVRLDALPGSDAYRTDWTRSERIVLEMRDFHWTDKGAEFPYADQYARIDPGAGTATYMKRPDDVGQEVTATNRKRFFEGVAMAAKGDDFRISDAGVASRGGSPSYTYVANRAKRGEWRHDGTLDRIDGKGRIKRVRTKTELLASWWLSNPTVSPDERFVAYVGTRDHIKEYPLAILFPFVGSERWAQRRIFIWDSASGREYYVAQVEDPSSLQWSSDSRRLYFADVDLYSGSHITCCHIDIPPTEIQSDRKEWRIPLRESYVMVHGGRGTVLDPSSSHLALHFRSDFSKADVQEFLRSRHLTLWNGPDSDSTYVVGTIDIYLDAGRLHDEAAIDYIGPVFRGAGEIQILTNRVMVRGDFLNDDVTRFVRAAGGEFETEDARERVRTYRFPWSRELDVFSLADDLRKIRGVEDAYPDLRYPVLESHNRIRVVY